MRKIDTREVRNQPVKDIDYSFLPEKLDHMTDFREHHPIILKTFVHFYDYIGTRTSRNHVSYDPLPWISEDYFEWIDVLMSVHDAKDSYTIVELGAGYGAWGVRGYQAAKNNGVPSRKAIFAEAEPAHNSWLHEHVALNEIPENDSLILNAAISDCDGHSTFYVGQPDDFDDKTAKNWYGQCLTHGSDGIESITGETYYGLPVQLLKSGYRAIEVEKRDIYTLIDDWGMVDLLDMDVQGEELRIVSRAIEKMNSQVKRIHVGTHATAIEEGLRDVLSNNGWICVRDFETQKKNSTPYGEIDFQDGIQSWINPRFNLTWG